MTIPIYVPSRGRHAIVQEKIMRHTSPRMRKAMRFVVPPGELDAYAAEMARCWGNMAVPVLSCPEEGIAATRRWIGEEARRKGQEKFLMLDDDLWFYTRKSPTTTSLRYSEHDDIDQMLLSVEAYLDYGYAHVAVSPREGNNRAGVGGTELVRECTRTLRALAYRTEDFLSVEHGRVEVMEDFDVNIQLLRRGRPNVELCYWAQGQRATNMDGGCSIYRSHEVHERSAKRLAELHAPFVRLRWKENKTGPMSSETAKAFARRREVTIYWKKAFEEGRRNAV